MNTRDILKTLGLGIGLITASCVAEPQEDTNDPLIEETTDKPSQTKLEDLTIVRSHYEQREPCRVPETTAPSNPFSLVRQEALENFRQSYDIGNFPISGGPGVTIADFNNDSYDDIYFPSSHSNGSLFLNDGNGGFSQTRISPRGAQFSVGSIAFDYNNDGYPDLLVIGAKREKSNDEGLVLYRNDNGTFSDVTAGVGISNLPEGARFSAAACDVDRDGDLDFIVGGYINLKQNDGLEELLFINHSDEGEESFTEEANERGLNQVMGLVGQTFTYVVLCADINGDRHQDIIELNDGGRFIPNGAYVNRGDGYFESKGEELGLDFSSNQIGGRDSADAMGGDIGDIDLNGIPEIAVTNVDGRTMLLFRGRNETRTIEGRKQTLIRYSDIARDIGIESTEHWAWGVRLLDTDNDMDQDIVFASSISVKSPDADLRDRYFRNEGWMDQGRVFTELYLSESRNSGYGLATGDFELDGRLEIIVTNTGIRPDIFSTNAQSNWVLYKLTGTTSNRDALGSIVRITARDGCTIEKYRHNSGGFASSDSAYVHSGLGPAQYAETTVVWPTGETEEFGELEANYVYELVESSGEARRIK